MCFCTADVLDGVREGIGLEQKLFAIGIGGAVALEEGLNGCLERLQRARIQLTGDILPHEVPCRLGKSRGACLEVNGTPGQEVIERDMAPSALTPVHHAEKTLLTDQFRAIPGAGGHGLAVVAVCFDMLVAVERAEGDIGIGMASAAHEQLHLGR